MKKEEYYLMSFKKKPKTILYLFFGLVVFLIIFFPFFAVNMRYQMGYIFICGKHAISNGLYL
ncbi:MAG: hypothetical protein ACW99E_21805 [Promethearchaeota archaeon]